MVARVNTARGAGTRITRTGASDTPRPKANVADTCIRSTQGRFEAQPPEARTTQRNGVNFWTRGFVGSARLVRLVRA
eukprot:4372755-Prymnesium_polylepis.1